MRCIGSRDIVTMEADAVMVGVTWERGQHDAGAFSE